MSDVRVISTEGLRSKLKDALGDDSLLFQRFDLALRDQDERLIEIAMDSLRLYPETVRAQVEETLLDWLFGGDAADGLADLPTANARAH